MKTPTITYRRPYLSEGSSKSYYGAGSVYIQEVEEKSSEAAGSGFCISKEGHIVTNAHVAAPYTQNVEMEIETLDGKRFGARLIGVDYSTDLAVLQVENAGLEPLTWAEASKVATGEEIWAIGNPLNIGLSITKGIMPSEAKFRAGLTQIENFISIDIKITGGNSGGPTIDCLGQVVGVNTLAFSKQEQNLNMCICSTLARKVIEEMVQKGTVKRSFLGLGLGPLDEHSKKRFKIPYKRGVVVEGFVPGSPAEKLGILPGDLICAVNNQPTLTTIAVQDAILNLPVGSRVQIHFFRGEQLKEAFIVTQERPPVPRIPPVDDLARHLDVQFKLNADGKVVMSDLEEFGLAKRVGMRNDTVVTKLFPAANWEVLDKNHKTIQEPGRPVRIDSLAAFSEAIIKSYLFDRIAFIFEGKDERGDVMFPLIIIETPMIIA